MAEPPDKPTASGHNLASRVGQQANRRIKARRNPGGGVWFGLGMMGLIGWSVVVPTLLGAALGQWIDSHHPGDRSWTLALLVAGLLLGCWNAWRWVANQDKTMHEDSNNDDK